MSARRIHRLTLALGGFIILTDVVIPQVQTTKKIVLTELKSSNGAGRGMGAGGSWYCTTGRVGARAGSCG